jgi:hypothetical protein
MDGLELYFVLSLMDMITDWTEAMIGHATQDQHFQVRPFNFNCPEEKCIGENPKCQNGNTVSRCDYE